MVVMPCSCSEGDFTFDLAMVGKPYSRGSSYPDKVDIPKKVVLEDHQGKDTTKERRQVEDKCIPFNNEPNHPGGVHGQKHRCTPHICQVGATFVLRVEGHYVDPSTDGGKKGSITTGLV